MDIKIKDPSPKRQFGSLHVGDVFMDRNSGVYVKIDRYSNEENSPNAIEIGGQESPPYTFFRQESEVFIVTGIEVTY